MQAQYDISVKFHSLSYNLKSRGYSPTVLYCWIFLFSWKCLSSLKALQSALIVISSEKDFLTNNNFEKPTSLKAGARQRRGFGAPVCCLRDILY